MFCAKAGTAAKLYNRNSIINLALSHLLFPLSPCHDVQQVQLVVVLLFPLSPCHEVQQVQLVVVQVLQVQLLQELLQAPLVLSLFQLQQALQGLAAKVLLELGDSPGAIAKLSAGSLHPPAFHVAAGT